MKTHSPPDLMSYLLSMRSFTAVLKAVSRKRNTLMLTTGLWLHSLMISEHNTADAW